MSLASEVLRVLHGPAVARIRFRFPNRGGGIVVTQHAFYQVASAIISGRVIVQHPTDDFNDDTAARYDTVANKMEIVETSGWINEGFIVHECLHAYYDLMRLSIDANAEEASAYVCYSLYLGLHLPDPNLLLLDDNHIYRASGRIALKLLSQFQNSSDIPMVDEDDWFRLRWEIGQRPAYRYGPAGRFGMCFGRPYRHDG